jgi:hypothetical protein
MVGGLRGGPPFRRLHRLTVDDRGAGGGGASERTPEALAEAGMQGLQRPVAAPGTEGVKHRLPGREVMGQLSPGAAAAHHVEDRVGDLASLPARRSATALDGRDQRLQKRPFFVREVGGVGLALALGKGHVLSLLRCPWQASLPALCSTSAQSIPFPNTLSQAKDLPLLAVFFSVYYTRCFLLDSCTGSERHALSRIPQELLPATQQTQVHTSNMAPSR